tara:strand:+ start:444 stop:632 length:189 start_codon:yes stop_codon:yes gene_type:complete
MTTRAKVTQAEVERMLRAASKCGANLAEMVVQPDGGVRLIFNGVDQPATNDNIAGPKQWPAT